jgi:anti-sigma regulatory factor (Ser/Thr protein kinase)
MKRTIPIRNERDIATAIATAIDASKALGFDDSTGGSVATAVSEVAWNIVKYAKFGEVVVRPIDDPSMGLEIVARDSGPGIDDVDAAMSDHFSTSGTLGLGLPGTRRLMDEFDVRSTPGVGTVVTMRKYLPARSRRVGFDRSRSASGPVRYQGDRGQRGRLEAAAESGIQVGSYLRPHRSEIQSGDLIVLRDIGEDVLVVVLDALGHGPNAARIAQLAHDALLELSGTIDVLGVLELIDTALRGTDGAAACAAITESVDRAISFASVGNVRARLFGTNAARIAWTEGTLGLRSNRPRVSRYRLGDDTFVSYTDGVGDRFEQAEYPGILTDAPDQAAERIVKNFGRDYDDAACAVVRFARQSPSS